MQSRKPSWPLWCAAVLIGLPVLYVLSFGPACWLVSNRYVSFYSFRAGYHPLIKMASDPRPEFVQDALWWWAIRCHGGMGLKDVQLGKSDPIYRISDREE